MKINYTNEIREELLSVDMIHIKGDMNRSYRKAMSELRKEGVIFIRVSPHFYKRIEKCSKEEIDKYINTAISSWNTQYFNTIVPVKQYMTDEQLKELHNGGLFEKRRDLNESL